MDSEIKLRAWDRDNKKMIYFDEITFWEDNKFWGQTENNQSLWRGTYKNLILMQYTGLHDKNGKEIYEGDIILGADEGNYEITDKNGCFGFWQEWLTDDGGTKREFCPLYDCNDIWQDIIEVLGNIHENPELIKEV